MFINYEHENHVYNVSVERRENKYFITYNNTEYTVEASEIKHGYLKIKLGDKIPPRESIFANSFPAFT